jgi:hypothetical protein
VPATRVWIAVVALAAAVVAVVATPSNGARSGDRDRDGLSDRFERKRTHTDPRKVDTDADGLVDGYEWRRSKTSPVRADSDRDDQADALEVLVGTDPREPSPPAPPAAPSRPCDVTVAGLAEARAALLAAAPGGVVCLPAGQFGGLDLKGIVKADYVTLRGAAGRATTLSGAELDGSSFLVVEGFRFTGAIAANRQLVTHHIVIRENEIGPASSGIVNTPSWSNAGHHDWTVERNFFHDIRCNWPDGCPSIGPGYAIAARGNAPRWTVRYNRFERILEDMIQSGEPDGWVVDHNWFGPGEFNRPSGYTGHPDLWQTLDSGADMTFTNNVTRDSNQSLGFIFGDVDSPDGFRNIVVTNNLFVRPVYGVGETCQFSPTDGFVFEQNTLVSARGCRWGSGGNTDWPDGRNYSIKRNVLAGGSSLSCNDTSAAKSCPAFNAGSSQNARGWSAWRDTTWYVPTTLGANVGARLGPGDFQGFPFGAGAAGPSLPGGVSPAGVQLAPIRRRHARAYLRTMLRARTDGRVRKLSRACAGTGSPVVTCFLRWRIGDRRFRADVLLRRRLEGDGTQWRYGLRGRRTNVRCARCKPKRLRWSGPARPAAS